MQKTLYTVVIKEILFSVKITKKKTHAGLFPGIFSDHSPEINFKTCVFRTTPKNFNFLVINKTKIKLSNMELVRVECL